MKKVLLFMVLLSFLAGCSLFQTGLVGTWNSSYVDKEPGTDLDYSTNSVTFKWIFGDSTAKLEAYSSGTLADTLDFNYTHVEATGNITLTDGATIYGLGEGDMWMVYTLVDNNTLRFTSISYYSSSVLTYDAGGDSDVIYIEYTRE
jgi:hypothetical protein